MLPSGTDFVHPVTNVFLSRCVSADSNPAGTVIRTGPTRESPQRRPKPGTHPSGG